MTGKLLKEIELLIEKALERRVNTPTNEVLPSGYNPLSAIRGGLFHWVAVPFNGKEIWCELRCLNATQLETCGSITNIVADSEGKQKSNYTMEDMLEIRNYQEKLAQGVLNKPTFDEIGRLVGLDDFVIKNKKKELEELEEQAKALSGKEREEIDERIKLCRYFIGFLLPTDTMTFLTRWAMGNDISDISKISHEKFIEAASLAKIAGKDPSDYLQGTFTDFNKKEINIHAWGVWEEYLKLKERDKSNKYRWFNTGSHK